MRCTWFNRPWLEYVGRTLDREVGDGWTENVHPDDLPRCLETYASASLTREPFRPAYRLRRHDDVSRVSRGKIQLRVKVLELAPVVESAVETVRPLIVERKHRLDVSVPSEGLRVKADPTRLEQIVVNLLANAAKYTESGGRIELS